jgi:hypothetical protein
MTYTLDTGGINKQTLFYDQTKAPEITYISWGEIQRVKEGTITINNKRSRYIKIISSDRKCTIYEAFQKTTTSYDEAVGMIKKQVSNK